MRASRTNRSASAGEGVLPRSSTFTATSRPASFSRTRHLSRKSRAGVLFPNAEHGCEPALAVQVPHSKFGSEGFLETLAQRVEVERHGGRET